jgi:hypothetical protein
MFRTLGRVKARPTSKNFKSGQKKGARGGAIAVATMNGEREREREREKGTNVKKARSGGQQREIIVGPLCPSGTAREERGEKEKELVISVN